MRFTEIGQQLRAYRLESGLRAEEIAAQLGVSRAALYRYEKGDVIKLDTVQRLAEMLKISPLSLLGMGIEYYSRPVAYFERLRQLEGGCEQILAVAGPTWFMPLLDAFDVSLTGAYQAMAGAEADSSRRGGAEQLLGILAARRMQMEQRRPGIICLFAAREVRDLLEEGVAPGMPLAAAARRQCRGAALATIEAIAAMMSAEPMGLQFGIVTGHAPSGGFVLLRSRERSSVIINPLRPDTAPDASSGVAVVTASDDAVAAHQRIAEELWRKSLKGQSGAETLHRLMAANAAIE